MSHWKLLQLVIGVTLVMLFVLGCGVGTPESPTATPTLAPPTSTPTPELPTATPTSKPAATPTRTPTPAPTSRGSPGVIVFTSDRDGPYGIYAISADGSSDVYFLSLHPFSEIAPAWSPDGEKIAFTSSRAATEPRGDLEIYVMNADGTGLMRLTNSPANNGFPDWSPDGQKIAFQSDRDGDYEIYVMNADGTDQKRLTYEPAIDEVASWSPDGQRIVFVSNRDGNYEIYLMDADGSNTTRLTDHAADDASPVWSPDGQQIAFVSDRDGNEEIYLMNADGSEVRRITNNPGSDVFPDWSPDGRQLVFASDRQGSYDLYVMNADGSQVQQLTNDQAQDLFPRWSPPHVALSDEPWLGPPYCARDADGDDQVDTATTTFTTEDRFYFVVFPYRNMRDGLPWSYVWITTDGLTIPMAGTWERGEEPGAFLISYFPISRQTGVLVFQLFIGDELVQEIQCEVVEP
jgi:dipeptidyl aminopeptidase/acylaminoacyl peptidase